MSRRLTHIQRIGLLLTGILMILCVIASALAPRPQAVEATAAVATLRADSAATDSADIKPRKGDKKPGKASRPKPRDYLDETF